MMPRMKSWYRNAARTSSSLVLSRGVARLLANLMVILPVPLSSSLYLDDVSAGH